MRWAWFRWRGISKVDRAGGAGLGSARSGVARAAEVSEASLCSWPVWDGSDSRRRRTGESFSRKALPGGCLPGRRRVRLATGLAGSGAGLVLLAAARVVGWPIVRGGSQRMADAAQQTGDGADPGELAYEMLMILPDRLAFDLRSRQMSQRRRWHQQRWYAKETSHAFGPACSSSTQAMKRASTLTCGGFARGEQYLANARR